MKGELEMDAVKYLKEKNRMFDSLGRTGGRCKGVNCKSCPFDSSNNGMRCGCVDFQVEYPEKAVAIVEKWSKENPRKTILQDFLEKYPNAKTDSKGEPKTCCVNLGYKKYDECDLGNCNSCWNRSLEG